MGAAAAAARDIPDPAALAPCPDAPPLGHLDDAAADERAAADATSSSSSSSSSSFSSAAAAAAAALAGVTGVNLDDPNAAAAAAAALAAADANVTYCGYCGWEGHKTNRSRGCTFHKDYVDGSNQGRKKKEKAPEGYVYKKKEKHPADIEQPPIDARFRPSERAVRPD